MTSTKGVIFKKAIDPGQKEPRYREIKDVPMTQLLRFVKKV